MPPTTPCRIASSCACAPATAPNIGLWITRRYLALLWPILMKMADGFSARKAAVDPLTRSTLAELAHGAAVGQADFASEYQEGSSFPLGSEPILLAKISLRPPVGDTQTVLLLPQSGRWHQSRSR
jgi:hypothetical protein